MPKPLDCPLNHKERVMNILAKQQCECGSVWTGMGAVTLPGIKKYGHRFAEIHSDPRQMADAAKSTHELYDWDAVVVPFDMVLEAEFLGCKTRTYDDLADPDEVLYPTVPEKIVKVGDDINVPKDLANAGRVPVVIQAIKYLKEEVGDTVAVGSWVLGPYTMLGQISELDKLLKATFKKPKEVGAMLDTLTDLVIELGNLYRDAGADYMVLREPGVATDILSPRIFEKMIQPRLARIIANWPQPKILHICGQATDIIEGMYECEADALSVDIKTDIGQVREKLGEEVLLFGQYDVWYSLCADEATAADAVNHAVTSFETGVDAVWPGCDLWPVIKDENMHALVDAIRERVPKRPEPEPPPLPQWWKDSWKTVSRPVA